MKKLNKKYKKYLNSTDYVKRADYLARGKNKLPTTIKEGVKELKELWQLKKQ